ncbi:eukaryotic aspartyl protease domain-containing protein [Ditylenchus destructor]|nr:eukaryotic aspartyl protease domain-containing protein [Ditylenchus destructor]
MWSNILLAFTLATSSAFCASVLKVFEIEAQVVDLGVREQTQSFVGTQLDTKSGSIDLQDFNSVALLGKVKCNTDKCKKRNQYFPDRSSTFTPFNPAKTSPDGEYVKDVLNFAGLTANQTIRLVQTETGLLDPTNSLSPLYDGEFSLSFAADPKDEKTPVQNVLDQLAEKVVSIWVAKGQPNTTSVITFGSKDTKNCQNDWNFFNLSVTETNKPPKDWAVDMTKLEWGNKTVEVQQGKPLYIDPMSGTVDVDWDTYKTIKSALNADDKNIVNCSTRNGQPPIKITVGGKVYEIPVEHYIVDLKEGNDKCRLTVFGVDPSLMSGKEQDYKVGLPFLRSWCTAMDFGSTDDNAVRRVGFATPGQNSVATHFASWLMIGFAHLFLFIIKPTQYTFNAIMSQRRAGISRNTLTDFGETFVERERQYRFRKSGGECGRARSEIGATLPHRYISQNDGYGIWNAPRRHYVENDNCDVMPSSSGDGFPINEFYNAHERKYSPFHELKRIPRNPSDLVDKQIYYFGVVQLSLERVRYILAENPPPALYYDLNPIEKAAYLYYFTIYGKYLTAVIKFKNVFNREFYKYTSQGCTEDVALWKICKHTQEEYKQKVLRKNQQVYKHLFSEERDSLDSSRNSYTHSSDHESEENSLESESKEPLLFRVPHTIFRFAVGGRVIALDPQKSVSSLRIEEAKIFCRDFYSQKTIEILESFKGPLIPGRTQSHNVKLFIERQIDRVLKSNTNQSTSSYAKANDCLLIWRLLEMLIHQHGKVTGPDLARLLIADDDSYSTKAKHVHRRSEELCEAKEKFSGNYSQGKMANVADIIPPNSMEKFTSFLLGGHVEEAINSATNDGLLFEALLLANRLYPNDRHKIYEIETKLLNKNDFYFNNPISTLISVAADESPTSFVANVNGVDCKWRAHVAMLLANLQTKAAIDTVCQVGMSLERNGFHSAADFCFLAVHLLAGYDCFNMNGESYSKDRKHIKLISATWQDDKMYQYMSHTGWSILDFQATEIFEYSQRLSDFKSSTTLSRSLEFQKCRLEYMKLLEEYGGFNTNISDYCSYVATSILYQTETDTVDKSVIEELCDLAERFQHITNRGNSDQEWITKLKSLESTTQREAVPTIPIPDFRCSETNFVTETSTNDYFAATDDNYADFDDRDNVVADETGSDDVQHYSNVSNIDQNFGSFNHKTGIQNSLHDDKDIYANAVPQKTPYEPPEPFVFKVGREDVYTKSELTSNYSSDVFNPMCFAAEYAIPEPPGNFANPNSKAVDDVSNQLPAIEQMSTDPCKRQGDETQNMNRNISHNKQMKIVPKSSGGIFANLMKKLIPQNNEMILPDDTNPSLRYDIQQERWVGEGMEADVPPPPPGIPQLCHPAEGAGDLDKSMPLINTTFSLASIASTQTGLAQSLNISGGTRKPLKNRYYNAFQ